MLTHRSYGTRMLKHTRLHSSCRYLGCLSSFLRSVRRSYFKSNTPSKTSIRPRTTLISTFSRQCAVIANYVCHEKIRLKDTLSVVEPREFALVGISVAWHSLLSRTGRSADTRCSIPSQLTLVPTVVRGGSRQ